VEDAAERLSLYRRLSLSRSDEEVEEIRKNWQTASGRSLSRWSIFSR